MAQDRARMQPIADPARVGLTHEQMRAYAAAGISLYNAPRPLDSPLPDGSWQETTAPNGWFLALANETADHIIYGTWGRYMVAQDACQLMLVHRADVIAMCRALAARDGDEEYVDEYLAEGMYTEMAEAYGMPWLDDWSE